jgi:hypothetical protein
VLFHDGISFRAVDLSFMTVSSQKVITSSHPGQVLGETGQPTTRHSVAPDHDFTMYVHNISVKKHVYVRIAPPQIHTKERLPGR